MAGKIKKMFNKIISSSVVRKYRYKLSKYLKLYLSLKIVTIFSQEFRYRRLRRKPILTERHKALRLAWCYNNLSTNFNNYIFSDETTVRQYEVSNYHLRKS